MIKVKNQIDMMWGSPSFLATYWQGFGALKTDHIKRTKNYQIGSRESLKKLIKKTHKAIGNANLTNKHIVVGAGASQIILGLLSILGEMGHKKVTASAPHFSRFPSLSHYALTSWDSSASCDSSVVITTSPNNPDGKLYSPPQPPSILDCCYNWPQYTDEVTPYNHPIVVYSLSKAVGFSNTRIGWVILEDKRLAKKLEHWIEVTTGGLSVEAQIKAEVVLRHQLHKNRFTTVFQYGREKLKDRWNIILSNIDKLPFKVLNNSGMFLWAEGQCPGKIKCLGGETLHSDSGKFRLNIGCSTREFKKFLKLFKLN